jgi:IS4 transposase
MEHRLITSLLDPERAGAEELVAAYHSRWEFELAIDEIKSHQRRPRTPLRSEKPVGVVQEIYGLLIAHYVVRAVMVEGGEKGRTPTE